MAPLGPLARKIRRVYDQANANRGARKRDLLKKGGMIFFIYITPGGHEHLRLARPGRTPSLVEFRTMLDHWPHNRIPRNVTPKENREPGGHLFYLDANWMPLPEEPAPVQASLLPEGGSDA